MQAAAPVGRVLPVHNSCIGEAICNHYCFAWVDAIELKLPSAECGNEGTPARGSTPPPVRTCAPASRMGSSDASTRGLRGAAEPPVESAALYTSPGACPRSGQRAGGSGQPAKVNAETLVE